MRGRRLNRLTIEPYQVLYQYTLASQKKQAFFSIFFKLFNLYIFYVVFRHYFHLFFTKLSVSYLSFISQKLYKTMSILFTIRSRLLLRLQCQNMPCELNLLYTYRKLAYFDTHTLLITKYFAYISGTCHVQNIVRKQKSGRIYLV